MALKNARKCATRGKIHLVKFRYLSLSDFDSAALREHAWKRKLNSHANLLREFTSTFREAIKMEVARHLHLRGFHFRLEGWEVAAYVEVLEASSGNGKSFLVYISEGSYP